MIYFDNDYLKQYIQLGATLKVYVDRQWYSITDLTDLESNQYGVGIDATGKPKTFRYPEIEQINADGYVMSIDVLNSKAAGEAPPDASNDGGMDMGEPVDDKPDKKKPDSPEPPRESYRRLVADMITESRRTIDTTQFRIGDFVENTNVNSNYANSRGVVTNIMTIGDTDDYIVEYRIYNYGMNYAPNTTVSAKCGHLKLIRGGDEK